MKNSIIGKDRRKENIIELIIIIILVVLFGCFYQFFMLREKGDFLYKYGDYPSYNEFTQTIDCAYLFDNYPDRSFRLSFDLKSDIPGEVRLIVANRDDVSKHTMPCVFLYANDFYEHHDVVICPEINDASAKSSYISFYGQYKSGVISDVKNLTIEILN